MIKAKGNIEGKEVIILGLSTRNLWRLQKDEPIQFDGRPYGIPMEVMIVWGVDEIAIAKKLGFNAEKAASGEIEIHYEKDAP